MNIAKIALIGAFGVGLLAYGCGQPPKSPAPAANTNATSPPADGNRGGGGGGQKIIRDEAGPDNSHIKVRELPNGNTVSVRTWDSGPIAKVSRREQNGQARALRVVYRAGKIMRVEEKDAVDHALDWTAAQFDDAAKKSGKVVSDVPARGQGNTNAADDDDEK